MLTYIKHECINIRKSLVIASEVENENITTSTTPAIGM